MMKWTDLEVARLNRMVGMGMSYADIAKSFGPDVTRCAIGGKVKRLREPVTLRETAAVKNRSGWSESVLTEKWADRGNVQFNKADLKRLQEMDAKSLRQLIGPACGLLAVKAGEFEAATAIRNVADALLAAPAP